MVIPVISQYFEKPIFLIFMIPALILLFIIIKKDFVKLSYENIKARNNLRFSIFLLRSLTIILLIIALASPFLLEERLITGDPFVKIVVDNSTSYDLFNKAIGEKLRLEFEKEIGTEIVYMGDDLKSDIGDRVLENLKQGESILLISDGQNNHGIDLGDIALYANKLNATINVLDNKPEKEDFRIEVRGPSKVSAGVENIFTVSIDGTSVKKHHITIFVDGVKLLDTTVDQDIKFVQKFGDGYHKIEARLDTKDHFIENNVFYKTIKVVKKPKILLVSEQNTPFQLLIKDIYDVEVLTAVPPDLSPYYAVILNDLPAEKLDSSVTLMNDFLNEGNGLIVIGGKYSYERGNYKDSLIESILPVFVSGAARQEGDNNIAIVIDISGSTLLAFGSGTAADVGKALAIDVIKNLDPDNRLGVLAFDTEGRIVANLDYLIKQDRNALESRIKSLKPAGGTLIGSGIAKAIEMLSKAGGSKNIILISDGHTQGKDAAYAAAKLASDQEIKIFTLGVGENTNERIMKDIADIGSGSYFKASEKNNLKILFGKPDDKKRKDVYGITLIDKNHFISENLELDAKIYGFNQVVPKSTAKLIATTDYGDPLLSVWRFGLGRVASLLTDDGAVYASDLLSKKNSALLIRSINWIIGDPERKNERFIDIRDSRVFEDTEITYKSDKQPVSDKVTFYKIGENLYSGNIIINEVGFHSLLDATFAINYNKELSEVGMNPELQAIALTTNGQVFKEEDIDSMLDAIKSQSKRSVYQKWYYRWPFVLLAIALFVIEIFIRKIAKYKAV